MSGIILIGAQRREPARKMSKPSRVLIMFWIIQGLRPCDQRWNAIL